MSIELDIVVETGNDVSSFNFAWSNERRGGEGGYKGAYTVRYKDVLENIKHLYLIVLRIFLQKFCETKIGTQIVDQ
jgi:hypothetical protein